MAAQVPQWLTSILDANFHNPCKEHKDEEYTLFCLDCDGKVFCKSCKTQCGIMHADHVVQQVYKASHQAVLRIQDIGLLFEISEIHPYSINSYPVVFLRPRKKNQMQVMRANAAHKCEAKSMMQDLTKVADGCARTHEVLMISQVVTANGSTVLQFCPESRDQEKMIVPVVEPPKSFRKRSRKGIPKRAPFF
ncbi:hypothetical protein F2P56_014008 [Juglans regia]|uniref:B box-type domain-containing protein n=2 Tax=Juglans regia TaxID=51240 RepID=A0A834CT81_JUGRE|nr:uncharacterized protein At3g50808-like [Juglans regia]KAF5463881.1 hypothetical protein F2P56_014008 [Juglans regia]